MEMVLSACAGYETGATASTGATTAAGIEPCPALSERRLFACLFARSIQW
jgi:hypothetical protein